MVNRCPPRTDLLPVHRELARSAGLPDRVPRTGRYPARFPAVHDPNVHLWEEIADVDCAEAPDGEVLGVWFHLLSNLCIMNYDGYDLHLLSLCYFGMCLLNWIGLLGMVPRTRPHRRILR